MLKTQHVILLDYGAQEKTNDHHHSGVYRVCDSDVLSDQDDMFRLNQGWTTAKVPDLAKGSKINLREVTASRWRLTLRRMSHAGSDEWSNVESLFVMKTHTFVSLLILVWTKLLNTTITHSNTYNLGPVLQTSFHCCLNVPKWYSVN